ncbi:MAG: hypothetical protein AB7I30_16960 [Isosphaeraceae bacterium]
MRSLVPREPFVRHRRTADRILIETDRHSAAVATEGYVSGVSAGSFVDRATGARDLGFGLSIVDFLLEPAPEGEPVPAGQYDFNNLVHGKLAKRYVEGPQICTQAKRLPATVVQGDGFVAVTLSYKWNLAYPPRTMAGSLWEQTLIFPKGERFFLSADRVTSASEATELFFRIDMPGHLKHRRGSGFEHVYLSYHEPAILPSAEFVEDFPPDARFLYRRGDRPLPKRFIRGYQVAPPSGKGEGPWLVGMTLNPADVYQAWCHQRGYVCMIEEIGGRPTKPGDVFGACYLIGGSTTSTRWPSPTTVTEARAD